jgi:predicted Holliday junction resolvase-like endonuclease
MWRCSLRLSLLFFAFLATPLVSHAASLSLGPTTGTFTVGSTFDVSIMLNGEGQAINAVGALLQFPPDKLQLVSPSVGKSVIGVWVTAPQFDNQKGEINLEGVIPNGLKTDSGLLTTLTFRVKSVGTAVVKFSSQSRVLLNDGVGTDVLDNLQNGLYHLVLPPPAGPQVVSETHPDQTKWYQHDNLVLSWATEDGEVSGYSYVLNSEPIDVPDDTSEGVREGVSYQHVGDGRHYFHIKALRSGTWGETTHFAVQIDGLAPAEFPLEILPHARTSSHQPVIQFATTDSDSGLDHYELKLVSLAPGAGAQPLFIEIGSPYVPQSLALGDYDVIVRAYDVAGNYQEVTQRLAIVTPMFRIFSDRGLLLGEQIEIPWLWLALIILLLIIVLWFLSRRLRLIHFHIHRARAQEELTPQVAAQLDELQRYRERYGKALVLLLMLGSGLFFAHTASAAIPAPVVTSISRHISNKDIFYLGGSSEVSMGEVIVYLQNPATGELWSYRTPTASDGEWFYRHDALLPAGGYLLWTQAVQGAEMSPPGPQLGLAVDSQALQFGASRLSYQSIYLVIIFILTFALILLLIDIAVHSRRIKHKRAKLREEIRQAEEAIRRGFAVLQRDITHELRGAHEHAHRERLLADLAQVEKYVGKEVWDLEKAEYNK